MFIKKLQLKFLYIGRMDWGAGHLTIIVGTGDVVFANINCRPFDQFFQIPGVCPGDACGWNCLAHNSIDAR